MLKKSPLLIIPLLLFCMLASCVPTKDLTYLREGEEVVDSLWVVNKQHQPYRVQVNDVLSIRVKALDPELVEFFNPAAGGESGGNALSEGYYYDGFSVDRHGKIRIPTIGEISVLGYTTEEIREIIEKKLLDEYLKENAELFVTVKLAGIRYTIAGEVGSPGTKVELAEQLTLLEAIANSGDIPVTGDRKDIRIIRQYAGGQRVHHVDLTKIDAMNSPYYFVQPNDVIIVNPLPQKSLGVGTTGLSSFTTIFSLLTSVTAIILLITR
ncbi:MAG: sugar transporter [Cytophagaceae bacterium]|nr:sugar transporter [Cytophagaceae bacterium]|tara:strand:+ start:46 stop:846 length:801 start_codon:yes stop_codon:yes gene_type:complete